jgi:uncharacterized protein (TIGR03435 family)
MATAPVFSQGVGDARPAFDVASVKPSVQGSREQMTIQPGGRLTVNGFPLQFLVAVSYRLAPFQMSGANGWMASDRWSIETKAEEVSSIPAWSPPYLPEVIAVRLRALLEDRFALKVHRETRELKAYTLTIAKNGSRLITADAPPPSTPQGGSAAERTPPPGSMAAGPGVIIASAVTMDQIVNYLNRIMDLPVIDKTGLTGHYNIRLRFAPESSRPLSAPPPADGSTPAVNVAGDPSIFVALEEQLGLSLTSRKEAVEVLVIDSARRPAEN